MSDPGGAGRDCSRSRSARLPRHVTCAMRIPGSARRRWGRLDRAVGRRRRSIGRSFRGWHPRATTLVDRRPYAAVCGVDAVVSAAAGLKAGPIAALLAAVYVGAGLLVLVRCRVAVQHTATLVTAIDTVAELAADIRAGAAPTLHASRATDRWMASVTGTPAERAVLAAWRVSEQTGCPLAEVLDRVEADLRQTHRLRLDLTAHQAGARATALLLAVLPLGGVGLGYGIGIDPGALLLHTPLGAVCAVCASCLQIGGLIWTARLSRVEEP